MQYQYKTVPFIGRGKDELNAKLIAQQLTEIINVNSQDGWVFDQINNVNISVQAGCLASLFGQRSFEKRFDMLIFRKLLNRDLSQSSVQGQNISNEDLRPAIEKSAPLYQSSNLADVIKFLEAKGCSVIKVHKNPFLADGKDFKVLKDGNWQEYYKEELIEFANTLL